ncbi:helix-turn-helix domain-containing protein [Nocardia sp. NPDC058176]|uniref:helix-turn-helix domain-containing protein n=1 Tax=Nocardia sp. NPDC058176 TaxID=3346368 RepID=UPI0036DDD055
MANEPMTLELSSATGRSEACEQWEDRMVQTYVPLSVDIDAEQAFYGRVTTSSLAGTEDFRLTVLAGRNQEFRRSKSHIARSDEHYLLAGIQTQGRARLHQDGRSALILPGEMTFFDTSRPYNWTEGASFGMVLVQVPIRLLREQPGLEQVEFPTAITVPAASAAGVVAGFFRNLARIRDVSPEQADVLSGSALDLIGSAVTLAAGDRPVDVPADTLNRERVLAFLRDHYTDPELTVDEVAHACHISRRTLFRIFDGTGETLNTTLRRMRVRHAKILLSRDRSNLPAAVAFDSGFASERNFYRVFHEETGMTPGEYRQAHLG